VSAFFRKLKLLAEWFLDWVVLPWFQPNPGSREKDGDGDRGKDAG
jgi:hypothetical protein